MEVYLDNPFSHKKTLEENAQRVPLLLKIYEFLGALPEDRFSLVSSGKEALFHICLAHYFEEMHVSGRNHFLLSALEGEEEGKVMKAFEKRGCYYRRAPVNKQGHIECEQLAPLLSPRTSLFSMSWADSLTGVIQPLHEIAALCNRSNVRLHVDATQVIGNLSFRFRDVELDFLSFDGSKWGLPGKSGGVLIRGGRESFSPLDHESELSRLITLKDNLEILTGKFDHLLIETARLRTKFEEGVLSALPEAAVLFQEVDRVPHISALTFQGIHAESLHFFLSRRGIYATREGLAEKLRICGMEEEAAKGALSFSLSHLTTEEEIDYALEGLITAVKQLRKIWRGSCGIKG